MNARSILIFLTRGATILLAALVSHPVLAAQGSITTELDPPQIRAGQWGAFHLNLHNIQGSPTGSVPTVQGLEIRQEGTSQNIQFNNNQMSKTFTFNFRVRADKPGNYTIPEFTIEADGGKFTVPATTVVVTDKPVATTAPQPEETLSLTTTATRTDVFVGEKFPLSITLGWQDGTQLQSAGSLEQVGDSFEQARIAGEGVSNNVQRGNKMYDSRTWRTAITALKSGNQTLSFSMPLVVTVSDNNMPDPNDIIARFMGGSFPGFGHQEQVKVNSDPLQFNVQSLPSEGKPPNFTGGIGQFSMDDPALSTTDMQVGVPITLKLSVTGQGNFDRLQAPVLDLGTMWRSYKPKETFQPKDPEGFTGIKTFEYVLMPLSDNITQLPAPKLNYFNPETRSYVEIAPNPFLVTVKPAAPGQAPAPLPSIVASTGNQLKKTALVDSRSASGSWETPSPRPLYKSGLFLVSQAIPGVVLVGFIITRRRRLRLENDPAYARRLQARRLAASALMRARTAVEAGHAQEFYSSAQRALQEAASRDRQDAAEALTWTEFDKLIESRSIDATTRDEAREIFEAGDALRFGGFTPSREEMLASMSRLQAIVEKMLRAK